MNYIELYGWGYLVKAYNNGKHILFMNREHKKRVTLNHKSIIRIIGVGNISTRNLNNVLHTGCSMILSKNPKSKRLLIASASVMRLRALQYLKFTSFENRFTFAKAFVESAIANKEKTLQYFEELFDVDFSNELNDLAKQLALLKTLRVDEESIKESINILLGIEGTSAHIYFQGLAKIIPKEFNFTGRTKRPPTDPINAALSYGYIFLLRILNDLLLDIGFDTHVGFLHEYGRGRESLSLDFLEQFRQPIVDVSVISLVIDNALINNMHFDTKGIMVMLNKKGKDILIKALKLRMKKFQSNIIESAYSLRDSIINQSIFKPFIWRD